MKKKDNIIFFNRQPPNKKKNFFEEYKESTDLDIHLSFEDKETMLDESEFYSDGEELFLYIGSYAYVLHIGLIENFTEEDMQEAEEEEILILRIFDDFYLYLERVDE